MTSSRCTNCVLAALPFKGGFSRNKLVGKWSLVIWALNVMLHHLSVDISAITSDKLAIYYRVRST